MYINSAILNGLFPDELKLVDVTPLYKKSDPEHKTKHQPIVSYHHYPKSLKKYCLVIYVDFD